MTADSDVGIDENDSAALGTTSEATASTPTPEPTGTGSNPRRDGPRRLGSALLRRNPSTAR
jgi:hypothetical protein